MANTTLNPADQNAVVLTGGNLIATSAGTASGVRSIAGVPGNKWYWEWRTGAQWTGGNSAVGVANGSASLSAMGGSVSGACTVYNDGSVYRNGPYIGINIGAITSNTIVGIALDMGAYLLWFRKGAAGNWNGSGTADPATGTGGISISSIVPGVSAYAVTTLGAINDVVTANFGDSAFSGVVPSGFTAGLSGTVTSGTYTAWNPADRSAATLSQANLTATSTGSSGYVRAVNSQASGSGSFYWEYRILATPSVNNTFGFCPLLLSGPSGATAASLCGMYGASGNIWVNGSNAGATIGTRAVNDVVGVALNLVSKSVWFRVAPSGNWNGSGTANPATAAGGISVSSITGVDAAPMVAWGASGDQVTANFGDTAFTGAVPAGFTAGWTVAAGGGPTGGGTVQARALVLA